MSAIVKNLRLLQAWYLPAGPEPEEAMPSKYRAFKEAADALESLSAQLAERDAELAALKGHADRLAYVLGEGNAVNAYRAAYPKE